MVDSQGNVKTDVEILIDRINKIKNQLPVHTENEEEEAFNEAAEEQYLYSRRGFVNQINRRRN